MRTHMIQQYKKLKNSPVRSPSPDYACRNHNGKTGIPLEENSVGSKAFIKNSTAHFPNIPAEILIRKRTSQAENENPGGRSDDTKKNINNSTAIQNSDLHKIWPLPEVSDFGTEAVPENRTSMATILRKIEQLFKLVNSNTSQSDFYEPLSWAEKLELIKRQILRLAPDRRSSRGTGSKKQFHLHDTQPRPSQPESFNQEWNHSPTRMSVEQSFCIIQMNELTLENNQLKRQITSLRLELIENQQKARTQGQKLMEGLKILRNSSTNLGNTLPDETQQDSSTNNSVYQFLREKISYLQNQLQNQITKFAKMSEEKQKEITILKEKIGQTSQLLRNQMQRSRKLLAEYKEQTSHIQSKSQFFMKNDQNLNTPSRLKTEIDDWRRDPLLERKGLPWQKEDILSIEDNQHFDESMYSEAERVEWQQFMPNRQLATAIQNIKNHYEEIIIKNSAKYHEVLLTMQKQLNQLKNYISQQDIETDSEHQHACQKCIQARQTIIQNQLQMADLQMEIGLLKKEIQEEKKQNVKLRELLQKSFVAQQPQIKNSQLKVKGRKLQKVLKKSVRSSDCYSNQALQSLSGSQKSQSGNSIKQADRQPSSVQVSTNKA